MYEHGIAARQAAERVDKAFHDLQVELTKQAGLDPTLLGIHPHNAQVSKHYGNPWPGVNYRRVELVLLLQAIQFVGYRIAEATSDIEYLATVPADCPCAKYIEKKWDNPRLTYLLDLT